VRNPRLAAVLVCATLVACGPNRGLLRCSPGETRTIVESLYFGTHKPGGEVTPAEWNAFLAEVVTSRFPDGLTVWSAAGQWRGESQAIEREPSYVVQIAHADSPERDTAIRAIVAEYERRFQQEAVMRVRSATCVSF
jgi:Protein of unknown function (DUF3574)